MISLLIWAIVAFLIVSTIAIISFVIFFIKMGRHNLKFAKDVRRQMHDSEKEQAKMHKEYEEHKRKNDEFFKKFER